LHRFFGLSPLLSLALFCNFAHSQPTSAPPTRAEILKGALTPERTCYHVSSYHLDVRIDPATKSLNGSNKITFQTVNDLTKMQVDLWSNLPISKITFDDQAPAQFTRELNAVFVELPEQARQGSTHSVTVFYSGVPTVAQRPPWEGGFTWDHDDEGNPWVVVTCAESGASIWWPNKDHASAKPDTTTISITVPQGLDEISNGRLQARTVLPDGWVRYDWFVSRPIDNYCVTFNIGKYAHFSDEYVNSDGEKLTLDYYVLPKNLEKAKEQFKQVKPMMAAYEKYFGKYPFYSDGYKLVESPHTGMEHQSCVAYGNWYLNGYRGRASSEVGMKFDFIIIHESAHEWWGNGVSMKDLADMWIHESFGAYAESLFVEDQYGHDQAIKYINAKKPNVRNDRPIIADYGRYHRSAQDMYDKGQLILNTLRSVLDDDALWISIMRGLQDKFRYQNASADEVFAYINEKSGRDLTYFFNQYFRHANIPALAVQTTKEGDSITARYRWEADVDNFHMPIKVTTAPGKYEFITPTTEWQTKKLDGVAPEDFKVAEDLFYINVRLRWAYLDPRRNNPTRTTTADARAHDAVIAGDELSERDHRMKGELTELRQFDGRTYRVAGTNGWFSWQLAVLPDVPQQLRLEFGGGRRGTTDTVEIFADDSHLATVKIADRPRAEYYPLDPALLRGKSFIVLRLQAASGSRIGGVASASISRIAAPKSE
jgi:aminopeptidase N